MFDTRWISNSMPRLSRSRKLLLVSGTALLFLGLFNARMCAAQTTEDQSWNQSTMGQADDDQEQQDDQLMDQQSDQGWNQQADQMQD